MLLGLVQLIVDALSGLINVVVAVLPSSPMSDVSSVNIAYEYLGYINYFLPVGQIVDVCLVWLGCIAGFYIYMALGRWAKLFD